MQYGGHGIMNGDIIQSNGRDAINNDIIQCYRHGVMNDDIIHNTVPTTLNTETGMVL